MNSKAKRTLQAIFAVPTIRTLAWDDIEALLLALGAVLTEGNGSRVKFDLEGKTIAYHRPHHPRTARAYQVEATRDFLAKLGIKP